MEIHEEFTEWAVKNGVKINGVAAHKFEGRGLGVIATKRHEVREVVYFIKFNIQLRWLVYTMLDAIYYTYTYTNSFESQEDF